MLAEPRRKNKISIDPQNVLWRNGDTIGKKLMSKMGWTDGKGIGRNEQGSAENIKLNPNYTNAGLGADHHKKQQDKWIAVHDDFAALLKDLNQGKEVKEDDEEQAEKISIQTVSKSSKKRIHYKFTRGKDLSLASETDKNAIFGNRKGKEKAKPKQEEVTDTEVTVNTEQFTEKNISASDYYAEKMKKWGHLFTKSQVTEVGQDTVTKTEIFEETTVIEQEFKSEKKKKKKHREVEDVKEEVDDEVVDQVVEEVVERKKKKKNKHVVDVKEEADEEPTSEVGEKKKKKKRRPVEEEQETQEVEVKPKKHKKNRITEE
ncbi:unnamed protein product [Bursaphelenchus okinawaensis]|uniref:G-patch domain-containing protein n=1 Tax=Bursaphelenchus okinawaensis TaxID=465554 RepID=A0A811JTY8_9BILA|nr:unnamed protein product [Bursaphelenchus okinawaensis]CAG9082343.1 unnamed protein product [Bursaphelenchus okinawaensis]